MEEEWYFFGMVDLKENKSVRFKFLIELLMRQNMMISLMLNLIL